MERTGGAPDKGRWRKLDHTAFFKVRAAPSDLRHRYKTDDTWREMDHNFQIGNISGLKALHDDARSRMNGALTFTHVCTDIHV